MGLVALALFWIGGRGRLGVALMDAAAAASWVTFLVGPTGGVKGGDLGVLDLCDGNVARWEWGHRARSATLRNIYGGSDPPKRPFLFLFLFLFLTRFLPNYLFPFSNPYVINLTPNFRYIINILI